MTDVLEEIDYYGFLVKNGVIKEFELLQHDRFEVYDIWRGLASEGRDICDALESKDSEHLIARKIKKFNHLIDSTKKYWEPDEKADKLND